MHKIRRCDGFLGCRTPKKVEEAVKRLCSDNNREVSEVINYLCRLFLEDKNAIRTDFFIEHLDREYEV